MSLAKPVFIVAAKRTAFGAFGGKLKGLSATDLGVCASKAAIASANIEAEKIDSVVFGNVIQSSSDAAYLARHIGLKSGLPIKAPALSINRLCGSGFQAVINAVQEILLGEAEIVLAGGTESMSQAPFALRNSRWGMQLGAEQKLEDTLWSGLTDSHAGMPMGITAENLGAKYELTREDCDEFALASQSRWAKAHQAGAFTDEIAPVELKSKKGVESFDSDEHPRVGVTIEQLAKLPAVFKKGGLVSAGNASGICDGGAALIIASEEAVNKYGLTPLARVLSYAYCGVEPSIMGIGPAPAIASALERAGKSLSDMALVEVNEAFAAQYISVERELGLDRSVTNACGGAIALGHPLAASGARILAHLTHQLRRNNEKLAVGSACIGGGQGVAVVIENV